MYIGKAAVARTTGCARTGEGREGREEGENIYNIEKRGREGLERERVSKSINLIRFIYRTVYIS